MSVLLAAPATPDPVQTGLAWLFAAVVVVLVISRIRKRKRRPRARWGSFGTKVNTGNPEGTKRRPTLVREALVAFEKAQEEKKAPKTQAKVTTRVIRQQREKRPRNP